MRIVTDLPALSRVSPPGVRTRCMTLRGGTFDWKACFRILLASLRADYLVLRFSLREVLFFCVAFALLPGCGCRIVTLDLFLEKLFTSGRLRREMVFFVLRGVHRFLVHFKDAAFIADALGVPVDRFLYIPYKVNGLERVLAASVSDAGYIFCGGRSRRDFATLFAAVKDAGYPVKVVTSAEAELRLHGSSLDGLDVPPNVEILQSDSSLEFFINTAARARLVVLPILKDSITQTGIGVYLIAMALRKCVIISAARGVSDVLTDGQALIVPPGDVHALREAITRAWNDSELRATYADAGYRYALPLGGEDEIARSILRALGRDSKETSG